MSPIDEIITNVMEFGLFDKWTKMSEGPSFRSLIASAKKKQPEEYIPYEDDHNFSSDRTIVLTMEHIIGALSIMGFGYFLAMTAFLCEQLVYRKVQQHTKSKFILYLHKFFSQQH